MSYERKEIGFITGLERTASEIYQCYIYQTQAITIELDDILYVQEYLEDKKVYAHYFFIVEGMQKYFEDSESHSQIELVVKNKFYLKKISILKTRLLRAYKLSTQDYSLQTERRKEPLPSLFLAPQPGAIAYLPSSEDLKMSFFLDTMGHYDNNTKSWKNQLCVGFYKSPENPFYIDDAFLNGEKGAHISISGMSGIATKTSFALFVLYSIFVKHRKSLESGKFVQKKKAIIFNVKGKDLLYIDQKNQQFSEELKEQYQKLGLPAEPFQNVGIYVPGDHKGFMPVEYKDRENVFQYKWSMKEILRNGWFMNFFPDVDTETNYGYLLQKMSLFFQKEFSKPLHKQKPAFTSDSFTWDKLKMWILELSEFSEEEDISHNPLKDLFAKEQRENRTLLALARRVDKISGLEQLLFDGLEEIPASKDFPSHEHPGRIFFEHDINIIDVDLESHKQSFVVSNVIQDIYKEVMENRTNQGITYYIFLDELNKYAPSTGVSPIKDILVDIAERGRSLGIILIGAQQTLSRVDSRISSNTAIKVIGKMDSGEINSPDYRYLPTHLKNQALILNPGEMLIYQPTISTPIKISFPFPAWATRQPKRKSNSEKKNNLEPPKI